MKLDANNYRKEFLESAWVVSRKKTQLLENAICFLLQFEEEFDVIKNVDQILRAKLKAWVERLTILLEKLSDQDILDLTLYYHCAILLDRMQDFTPCIILQHIVTEFIFRRLELSKNAINKKETDMSSFEFEVYGGIEKGNIIQYIKTEYAIQDLFKIIKCFFISLELRIFKFNCKFLADAALRSNAGLYSVFCLAIIESDVARHSLEIPDVLNISYSSFSLMADMTIEINEKNRKNMVFWTILMGLLSSHIVKNIAQTSPVIIVNISILLAVNSFENSKNSEYLLDKTKLVTAAGSNIFFLQMIFFKLADVILGTKTLHDFSRPKAPEDIIMALFLVVDSVAVKSDFLIKQWLSTIFLISKISSKHKIFHDVQLELVEKKYCFSQLIEKFFVLAKLDQRDNFYVKFNKLIEEFHLGENLEIQLFVIKAFSRFEVKHHRMISDQLLALWEDVVFKFILMQTENIHVSFVSSFDFCCFVREAENSKAWIMKPHIMTLFFDVLYKVVTMDSSMNQSYYSYPVSSFQTNPILFFKPLFLPRSTKDACNVEEIVSGFITSFIQFILNQLSFLGESEVSNLASFSKLLSNNLSDYLEQQQLSDDVKLKLYQQINEEKDKSAIEILSFLKVLFSMRFSDDQLVLECSKAVVNKKKAVKKKKKRKNRAKGVKLNETLTKDVDLEPESDLNEMQTDMSPYQFNESVTILKFLSEIGYHLRHINNDFRHAFDLIYGLVPYVHRNQFYDGFHRRLYLIKNTLKCYFYRWYNTIVIDFSDAVLAPFDFGISNLNIYCGVHATNEQFSMLVRSIKNSGKNISGVSLFDSNYSMYCMIRCYGELDLLPLDFAFIDLSKPKDQSKLLDWIYPLDFLSQPVRFFINQDQLDFSIGKLFMRQGVPAQIESYWSNVISNLPDEYYRKLKRLVTAHILENGSFRKFLDSISFPGFLAGRRKNIRVCLNGSAIYGLMLSFQANGTIPSCMLFTVNTNSTAPREERKARYNVFSKFNIKCSRLDPEAKAFSPGESRFGVSSVR